MSIYWRTFTEKKKKRKCCRLETRASWWCYLRSIAFGIRVILHEILFFVTLYQICASSVTFFDFENEGVLYNTCEFQLRNGCILEGTMTKFSWSCVLCWQSVFKRRRIIRFRTSAVCLIHSERMSLRRPLSWATVLCTLIVANSSPRHRSSITPNKIFNPQVDKWC